MEKTYKQEFTLIIILEFIKYKRQVVFCLPRLIGPRLLINANLLKMEYSLQ